MMLQRTNRATYMVVAAALWLVFMIFALAYLQHSGKLSEIEEEQRRLRQQADALLYWSVPRRATCPDTNDTSSISIKPLSKSTCLKFHDLESGDVAISGSETFRSIFVECNEFGEVVVYPDNDSCTKVLFEIPFVVRVLCFSFKDADYKIECKRSS